MPTRTELSHHQAQLIIDTVRRALDERAAGAAVAVVDPHGELIALLRTDGCPLASINNAIHKAFTAAREGAVLVGILLSGSLPALLDMLGAGESARLATLGWSAVILGLPCFYTTTDPGTGTGGSQARPQRLARYGLEDDRALIEVQPCLLDAGDGSSAGLDLDVSGDPVGIEVVQCNVDRVAVDHRVQVDERVADQVA